jgi:hypothetical protein
LQTETMSGTTVSGVTQRITVASGRASVKFAVGISTAQIDAELASVGAARSWSFGGGWYAANWTDGSPVEMKLPSLKALPGVLVAEASKAYKLSRAPNDPFFSSQYALAQVNAPAGWEYEVGNSTTVTIAVIDAGIDGTQPDLSGKMGGLAHQFCDPGANKLIGGDDLACVNDTTPATAACNHATHVAGVAAASTDNGTMVAGMSWGAQLLSLKVFRAADCTTVDCSDVTCQTDDQAIANAINFAATKANLPGYGRMVINMSLGGTGACSGVVSTAVNAAIAAPNNIVVVAAAGNDGGAVNSPGNCAGVIPMGATDNTGQVASFSSRGSELASNGLVAPGVSVLTTDVGGKTTSATGTSFASPMGAGLAALLLSAKPTLTPAQVQTLMRGGADTLGLPSTTQGAGQLDVYRSLRLATKGTLAGFDGEQKPIAFPNPFRVSQGGVATISYPQSLHGGNTDIKIYTMTGRIVRELSEPVWDGKNNDGHLVASGSYMFVVKSGAGTASGRLAVIR